MSDSDTINPTKLSAKLEAILYLKAQPMGLQEIADFALCDIEDVEEAMLELMQDYALRDSALEVVETDAGFSLQLREQYMCLVHTIVPTDIGIAALRTLAVIALKGPIPQTKLVEIRGSGAYQHVGDLIEEGFVTRRRQSNGGRSYSVNVTEKFYQYFEVDELPKLKLKKGITEKASGTKQLDISIAEADGSAPEVEELKPDVKAEATEATSPAPASVETQLPASAINPESEHLSPHESDADHAVEREAESSSAAPTASSEPLSEPVIKPPAPEHLETTSPEPLKIAAPELESPIMSEPVSS